jgi:hypothetical protein
VKVRGCSGSGLVGKFAARRWAIAAQREWGREGRLMRDCGLDGGRPGGELRGEPERAGKSVETRTVQTTRSTHRGVCVIHTRPDRPPASVLEGLSVC